MLTVLYLFGLMSATYNPQKKLAKLFFYFVSLVLLVSGLNSMQKLGLPLDGNFPLWIWAKIACWIFLVIVPAITIKKFPRIASKFNWLFVLVLIVAIFMGVYYSG